MAGYMSPMIIMFFEELVVNHFVYFVLRITFEYVYVLGTPILFLLSVRVSIYNNIIVLKNIIIF